MEVYTKAEVEEIGKTAYYLSVSALQKCIRRCDADRALNFAKVVWRMDQWRAYARLFTILFEDCGRDVAAMREFQTPGSYKEFPKIGRMAVAAAKAKKSKDANSTAWIIKGDEQNPHVLKREFKDSAVPALQVLYWMFENWRTNEWDVYANRLHPEYEWVLEFCKRATKMDHERFCVGAPFWFMPDTLEWGRNCLTNEAPEGIGDLFEGWFPLVACDSHTRPGKLACATYVKHVPGKFQETADDIETVMFHLEGWACNQLESCGIPFVKIGGENWLLKNGKPGSWLYEPEQQEYYRTHVLPELLKVRNWALGKVVAMDMELLRKAYHDFPLKAVDFGG